MFRIKFVSIFSEFVRILFEFMRIMSEMIPRYGGRGGGRGGEWEIAHGPWNYGQLPDDVDPEARLSTHRSCQYCI